MGHLQPQEVVMMPRLAVPNVTANLSTASVPITVLLYNRTLLCSFNVRVKGLIALFSKFLQRDKRYKRGLCRHAVYVRPSVCLSVCLSFCHVRVFSQNE